MEADPRGSELRVNTFVAGDQDNPAVAISPLGTFVVAWESDEQDGEREGIYARLYRSGGTAFGPEFRVNSTTEDDQINPDVAMDATGGFVVVWESESDEGQSIYAQRYNSNGQTINSEFRISPSINSDNNDPAIAQNGDGAFVVAWAGSNINDDAVFDEDPSSTGVYVQRYDTDGSPIASTIRVNTTTLNAQDNPEVAIQSDGSFIVVWESESQDTSGRGIFAQRYNASGNPIDIEFQVNTDVRNDQINPVIAVDMVGNFVIAWESDGGQDGSGSGIYARLYDANGNPQGQPFQVNSTTRGDQSTPSLGMDAEGNFTIAWTSDRNNDDDDDGIYAQQYTVNGARVGSEFRVNSTTESNQTAPSISTQSNGSFVVAWQGETPRGNDNDDLGDGDGLGIFAQRYQGVTAPPPRNRIVGSDRSEKLTGTGSADKILGYGGNDTLLGQGGNDVLLAGQENDTLKGAAGNDILKGQANQDILYGGTGLDTLYGGSGGDTMTGGAGKDVFVIGESVGLETIQDFQDSIDKLTLLDGLTFADLTIRRGQTDSQTSTVISVINNPIAILEGIARNSITEADFIDITTV